MKQQGNAEEGQQTQGLNSLTRVLSDQANEVIVPSDVKYKLNRIRPNWTNWVQSGPTWDFSSCGSVRLEIFQVAVRSDLKRHKSMGSMGSMGSMDKLLHKIKNKLIINYFIL